MTRLEFTSYEELLHPMRFVRALDQQLPRRLKLELNFLTFIAVRHFKRYVDDLTNLHLATGP